MHWLDCMHAPATVLVVRSKIWIALLVPVMVAFAVAVRIALSPCWRNELPASSSMRCAGAAGTAAGSSTSVHAAGLGSRAGLATAAGQGTWPSGVDATSGAIGAARSCVLHAAPAPDSGHCAEPGGTLRLTPFGVASVVHACAETAPPSTPATH